MDREDDTDGLIEKASQGDPASLGRLFSKHEERLRRMVDARLDRRLSARIDPSDILQETYLEYARCLVEYSKRPELPFFLWLRMLTGRKLQMVHRRHLGTQSRDAHREVRLSRDDVPVVSSECLGYWLLGRQTTPSQAFARSELQLRVQEALQRLPELDREILVLRHFELLSNSEAAEWLGISEAAASNRFIRAIKRMKEVISDIPGLDQGRV